LAFSIDIAYGSENLFKALCNGKLCSIMNRRPFHVYETLKQLLLGEMSGCCGGPDIRPIRELQIVLESIFVIYKILP